MQEAYNLIELLLVTMLLNQMAHNHNLHHIPEQQEATSRFSYKYKLFKLALFHLSLTK